MRWFALLLMAGCLSAQNVSPETLLLAKIKARMAQNLARLPNYTCQQTVERSVRETASGKLRRLDRLRLEIAFVGGKELLAWRGEDKFQERNISTLAPTGAFGTGSFALHAKAIFLSNAPTFQYKGQQGYFHEYSYSVPQFRSQFRIRVAGQEAIVGYQGSFSVDAKTLDLVRLEVKVLETPPSMRLQSASEVMEYSRAAIGGSEFLLPSKSELTMVDLSGRINRNRIVFNSCRQYAGESVVSFADPAETVVAPLKRPVTRIELPPDLQMNVRLESPIDFDESAVGDLVIAIVQSEVKRGGTVLLPKDAKVTGRIKRLENVGNSNYAIGIDFASVTFGDTEAAMICAMDPVGTAGVLARIAGTRILSYRPDSKTFIMHCPNGRLKLPRGYLILLRTMKSNSGVGENP